MLVIFLVVFLIIFLDIFLGHINCHDDSVGCVRLIGYVKYPSLHQHNTMDASQININGSESRQRNHIHLSYLYAFYLYVFVDCMIHMPTIE